MTLITTFVDTYCASHSGRGQRNFFHINSGADPMLEALAVLGWSGAWESIENSVMARSVSSVEVARSVHEAGMR